MQDKLVTPTRPENQNASVIRIARLLLAARLEAGNLTIINDGLRKIIIQDLDRLHAELESLSVQEIEINLMVSKVSKFK